MIIHSDSNRTIQYIDNFTTLANCQVHSKNLDWWQSKVLGREDGSACTRWLGVPSIVDLRSIVELTGWEEGAITGEEKLGHIKAPALPSIKRKRSKGSYGHTVSMTSIYNGNFDKAWLTAKKINCDTRYKKSGLVNIVVDVCANSGRSSEQMYWRGAVASMLSKALQKSGRSTQIFIGASSKGLYDDSGASYVTTTYIKCKDYGYPIVLDRLFAMTALSGFFRYYIWKGWGSLPFKLANGLGRHASLDESDLAYFTDKSPAIIVSDIWNEHQALSAVDTLLKGFL